MIAVIAVTFLASVIIMIASIVDLVVNHRNQSKEFDDSDEHSDKQ